VWLCKRGRVSGERKFRLTKVAGHREIAQSLRAECGYKFLVVAIAIAVKPFWGKERTIDR
jgi:hypothetical protein